MKWPWVSRSHYAAMSGLVSDTIRASDRALQREQERYAVLEARYADLLDKYHALKLQGAAIAEPRPVLPVREPDPIVDAVMLSSGTNAVLRKHLSEYARKQRAQDIAPAVIADAILNWTPADDGSDIAE